MGEGRLKIGSCGHVVEAIIGQYYQCPICDVVKTKRAGATHGLFEDEDPTPTGGIDIEQDEDGDHQCPFCGSWNTADFTNVWTPSIDPDWHCWDCGKMFKP